VTAPLLFDLDGTLTDNFPGIARSILYALERMGVAAPDEASLRLCMGPALRESLARLLDTGDADVVEHALALYRERYAELGWRENVVYEGVADALAEAARSSPVFLCTSKPEIYARRIVTLFGLAPLFSGVYGADLDGALDDKAKLFAHVVAREGLPPGAAIMIGDRGHDIRAARMNGARCVGVLWGYGSADELAAADALAAAPSDLLRAVAGAAAVNARPTSTARSRPR